MCSRASEQIDEIAGQTRKTSTPSFLMDNLPENRKQSLTAINMQQQRFIQGRPCHPLKPITDQITPLSLDTLPILPEATEELMTQTPQATVAMPTGEDEEDLLALTGVEKNLQSQIGHDKHEASWQ